jgi:hypothetical protein
MFEGPVHVNTEKPNRLGFTYQLHNLSPSNDDGISLSELKARCK